ncbi:hypothetical protein HHI36_011598 [Cryptolaemus montrouzieri]|uniref:Cytochrome c oxidase subunit n=1 Tax=Cryptolaemus montrouzieri TaxID=559131 RepID=A0ABD2MM79_9CUCU
MPSKEYLKKLQQGESTLCPDPRYTTTNVTNWCYRSFLDWHACQRLMGKNHKPCMYFRSAYGQLCPNAWIAQWEEQMKDGTFPGLLPPDPEEKE